MINLIEISMLIQSPGIPHGFRLLPEGPIFSAILKEVVSSVQIFRSL